MQRQLQHRSRIWKLPCRRWERSVTPWWLTTLPHSVRAMTSMLLSLPQQQRSSQKLRCAIHARTSHFRKPCHDHDALLANQAVAQRASDR